MQILASASDPALPMFARLLSSQSKLITFSCRAGWSPRARSAQTVGMTSGSPETPYTRGLPEFQPPPGHIRSYSRASASSRRRSASEGRWSGGASFRLISANEVGSTQLLVPGVQPQPRSAMLIGCRSLCEESLARKRRQGVESCGQSWHSHWRPAASAGEESSRASTQQLSAVTQHPDFCSGVDGQEPSISCAARRNCNPRARPSWASRSDDSPKACKAQHVGSTRLSDFGWNPHPPSLF